ncbi:hypothetical protein KAW38_02035 [Candidatus Micrarchaeota archaeon]|nr:hypothetical protein [Candidatus Micrarchaeota archaeon]
MALYPGLGTEYLGIMGITVAIMILYIVLVRTISVIIKRPEWTAYSNIELYQLFISVGIMVLALGIAAGTQVFFEEALGKKASTPGTSAVIEAASSFIQKNLNRGVIPLLVDLMSLEAKFSFYNAVELRTGPTVWNWTIKMYPGLEAIINSVRVLFFTVMVMYGTTSVQLFILYLIDAVMYPFVLPAGVVLRFIPQTRDAGIFLITLAIVFQNIYPALYVISEMALDDIWAIQEWGSSFEPYSSLSSSPPAMFSSAMTVVQIPVVHLFNYVFLVPFFEGVATISLVGLFIPSLVMTLSTAFVNALTRFFTGKG